MPDTARYAEFTGTRSAHYVAAPHTATIVNLAIRLGRPLLVEGEAGCGKTRLASAIAEELDVGLTVMTVKSTSQAKDLLYRFDALRRLQDAQDPANSAARQVHPYIDLEPLGHAIRQGQPQVVLIDEVDKADIDFPNDLLDVLDRFE
ncbi:MAG: AAA family ATPase, partial [Zoogloea sp.]|nr:AAA family ATPase [Zoogloea sp.]